MYKLICLSFDGDYQTEPREPVATVDDAWEVSNDMGSRWYFYPFHFVTTESCKTIVDAPYPLRRFIGKRVKTVRAEFKALSSAPEMVGVDVDTFAFALA